MTTTNLYPIVRSVDVGYGNTKYIQDVINGKIVARHFASIVHRPSSDNGSFPDSRDIYPVTVDGKHYEVGPGLDSALEGDVRVLHDNFIDTDDYMALLYGALSQMNVAEIDLLMVGLPVDLMSSKKAELENKLEGTHQIQGKTVIVRKANAIAQPLGGFTSFSKDKSLMGELNTTRNLLIDPGFFTVDFLVSTGLREIKGKSGSHPSGVSAYLKGIAKALSKDKSINFTNLSHIDEGLRTGQFKLYGQNVDLKKYHKQALAEIKPAVEAIANKVGDGRSIDRIILVGGGSDLFLDLIKKAFPHHSILKDDGSVVANVTGFQILGESWISSQRVA